MTGLHVTGIWFVFARARRDGMLSGGSFQSCDTRFVCICTSDLWPLNMSMTTWLCRHIRVNQDRYLVDGVECSLALSTVSSRYQLMLRSLCYAVWCCVAFCLEISDLLLSECRNVFFSGVVFAFFKKEVNVTLTEVKKSTFFAMCSWVCQCVECFLFAFWVWKTSCLPHLVLVPACPWCVHSAQPRHRSLKNGPVALSQTKLNCTSIRISTQQQWHFCDSESTLSPD